MEQSHIDELLERYLGLLDEYSRLRQDLSRLQSGVYQNIARANFVGERGMRYGQDHYDDRMQALRQLYIEVRESGVPVFLMRDAASPSTDAGSPVEEAAEEQPDVSVKAVYNKQHVPHGPTALRNAYAKYGAHIPTELDAAVAAHKEKLEKHEGTSSDDVKLDNDASEEDETRSTDSSSDESKPDEPEKKKKPSNNPLHWFGLFAPSALRTAQAQSIEAVEQVIPRMVSVNAEMANIEIEVRRARKKRAKVELAAEKGAAAPMSQDRTEVVEAT